MRSYIKLNFIYIIIWVVNVLLKYIPTFILRRWLLIFFGAQVTTSASIHRNVRVFSRGRLHIGSGSVVNNGCYLDNRSGIHIGDNVSIAHDVKIYTMGHDINSSSFAAIGAPVRINNYAVIFSNVLIMPGVTIGEGAVIYAGAVVSRDIPRLGVAAGNPARVIKYRSEDCLVYKLKYDFWQAP
ncbi:acyltransferase [Iodobacter sp. HSC-16F04]|uniref:Acyltransferase n=1 Tax=Iodobacter violaceini TaxID=3044271 RepID=A0ABX0KVA5_9NEIS|nr:acyltransferase [Iodobacter violacea]NHQ85979.1 acyltransferase [Iodobacter violacea]